MSTRRPIGPDALLVVSGGARGVTARCVVELARRYRCRFLLLGRSPHVAEPAWATAAGDDADLKRRAADDLRARGQTATPVAIQRACDAVRAGREIGQTLRAIEAAGGAAEYLPLDVTDAAAVARALPPVFARLGRPIGLIHGAGALADRPIERKSAADFDLVYGTKVRGLASLLGAMPVEELDYLVLFSSAAGFFGNPGQSDYALANEVLNRVAHLARQANPRCRVVALNWGPWDGGMVTPALKRMFAERGVDLIPADAGARALIEVLEDPAEPVQVVVGGRLATMTALPATGPRDHRLHRHLTLAANPFLRDHAVGGHPVLPAVCATQWMANAAEGLYPGYRFFSVEDLRILKGIVFDGQQAEDYWLELVGVDGPDGALVLDGRIWSQGAAGQPRNHYRARLTLLREPPPPPLFEELDLREDERAVDGERLYQDGTLFHGPAFQGIRRVLNATPTRLTMECALAAVPEADQGQFPIQTFNPFLADAQFQGQVVWARWFHDAASLPLSCPRGEHYRALPFDRVLYVSVQVRRSSEHSVVADITTHDREGRVFCRVLGAEVTLSRQLNAMFQREPA